MKRIATRGREKDSWATKEYLEKCVSMLEQSLKDAKNIVVIDTDKVDYSSSGNQQEAVIKIIWDAINNSIAHP